jgi:hypothetical protein
MDCCLYSFVMRKNYKDLPIWLCSLPLEIKQIRSNAIINKRKTTKQAIIQYKTQRDVETVKLFVFLHDFGHGGDFSVNALLISFGATIIAEVVPETCRAIKLDLLPIYMAKPRRIFPIVQGLCVGNISEYNVLFWLYPRNSLCRSSRCCKR